MIKKYKLYSDLIIPNAAGYYTASFLGEGDGNIDSGSIVVSNKTGGSGNLTGYIHPEKKAVFTLIKDKSIFISTDGTRMTLQNVLGKNQLSFIQSFLEFVFKYPIYDMEGDLYEGVDLGKKAYLVSYKYDNGKIGSATMTNSTGSVLKKTGEVIISPVTAPITSTRDAIKDPTAGNITKAVINDGITVASIAASFLVGPEVMEADVPVEAGVDAAVDFAIKELGNISEIGTEAGQAFIDQTIGEAARVGKLTEEEAEVLASKVYEKVLADGKINQELKAVLEKVPVTKVYSFGKDTLQSVSEVGANVISKARVFVDSERAFVSTEELAAQTLSKTEQVLNAGAVKVGNYIIKPVAAVAKSSAVVGAVQGAEALANKVGDSVGNFFKKLF